MKSNIRNIIDKITNIDELSDLCFHAQKKIYKILQEEKDSKISKGEEK